MIKLSIIIPVFNEQKKISQDILAADRFLNSKGLSGEIIVVDDGSTDDTAKMAQQTPKRPNPNVLLNH